MVYSSMVHVAGGEGGSIRHDGEMPSPAPRVDLAQSTAVKSLDRQAVEATGATEADPETYTGLSVLAQSGWRRSGRGRS